jgi:radical SAM protein with 4Fe4S-binding SPASM domain
MGRKQTAPFSIQIELNEGCNLGCTFCGLRGMREKGTTPWKCMNKETAQRIASEIKRIGWNSRLIFSMHGEPTLNPNCVRVIKLFRKALPNAVMSIMTNGYGLVNGFGNREDGYSSIGDRIEALKNAGLNDLIVDYYSNHGDAKTVEDSLENGCPWKVEHLVAGIPLYSNNPRKFRILFNPPIQKEGKINRHLCNHCGAAAPLDMSYQGKRCARPFRELSIRWDGAVAICCNDFRGEYPIGNILKENIDSIWYSKDFEAARILLYAGERSFKPCLGCNALSHRVGLLPDLKGKEEMPKPTEKILAYAKSVSNNVPLCGDNFVVRPWEE